MVESWRKTRRIVEGAVSLHVEVWLGWLLGQDRSVRVLKHCARGKEATTGCMPNDNAESPVLVTEPHLASAHWLLNSR